MNFSRSGPIREPFRSRENVKRKNSEVEEKLPLKRPNMRKGRAARESKENLQVDEVRVRLTRSAARVTGACIPELRRIQPLPTRGAPGLRRMRPEGTRGAAGRQRMQSEATRDLPGQQRMEPAGTRDSAGLLRLRSDGTSLRSYSGSEDSLSLGSHAETSQGRRETGELNPGAVSRPAGSISRSADKLPEQGPSSLRIVDCGIRDDGTICRCVRGKEELAGSTRAKGTRFLVEDSDSDSQEDSDVFNESSEDSSEDIDEHSSSEEDTYYRTAQDVQRERLRPSEPTLLHQCTARCPFGCRGERRPAEIIIYEGVHPFRFIKPGTVSRENPVIVDIKSNHYRRVGGRGAKKLMQNTTLKPMRREEDDIHAGPLMPQRVAVALDKPEVPLSEAFKHAWNPQDRSFNMRIKPEDPLTIVRQPVAQSTDSVRTVQGYSSGLHIFGVSWPIKQRGTHACVGVSTDRQTLHTIGYSSLIGLTDQSWGWDLGRLKALHKGTVESGVHYPAYTPPGFSVKTKFYLVLDCDSGTLGFISGGVWLGVAHSNLQGKVLYPSVSGVWGNGEVTLRYHGGMERELIKLSELCRTVVRQRCTSFSSLPVPEMVKKFLQHQ